MSVINYLNGNIRKQIIDDINTAENNQQKAVSKAEFEIYSDRLLPHITNYLKTMYSDDTVKEMAVIASINLARRIVNQEAAIYINQPEREFTGLTEDQEKVVEQIYEDMMLDSKLLKANQMYKLQNNQTHLQIVPINGKLKARVLMRHNMDAVESPIDPEIADAYLVTGFDYSQWMPRLNEFDDNMNQILSDPDDYKARLKMISVWSDEQNFIMDKDGNIISGPDTENKLGIMPFVDISQSKDGEYWIRAGSALTDFTIQFNAAESDTGHINRMQGFAQAYLIGPSGLMPQNIQIGPNYIVKLDVDPNNPVVPQFGFANPNPDLAGSIQYLEQLLSVFLTSRGVDPKIVNTKGESKSFSSGLERLLSMIQQFEPAKADFDIFMSAEDKIYEIIKAYVNTYAGTDILSYKIAQIPADSKVMVTYHKPEMIVSEQERVANIQSVFELGAMSKLELIESVRQVSKEKAMEILAEIKAEETIEESLEETNGEATEVDQPLS